MQLQLSRQTSPLGEMFIVTDADRTLRSLDFHDYEPRMRRLLSRHYGTYELTAGETPHLISEALHAYFAGDLSAVEKLPTRTGGTEFQRLIWKALRGIAPGETCSYGELARRIGKPSASRAVGLANGANPIAIVVPCHRVIGSGGSLTGYGGGLPRKRWLLDHEKRHAATCAAKIRPSDSGAPHPPDSACLHPQSNDGACHSHTTSSRDGSGGLDHV
ncbi:Methylated-DNA--protein-cysteine methyltransferase [Blastopirellula retiformator]|uniref:Methylated-DNA--protein-cysteine methyltransferase n=1 Tax=Blastopirellula retiformator TaxID=2527970 RepID=A0A5C5V8W5_9BACT|nr:Methylated-DNA--protein-cysteine methyltransferase [Blastopirellula retiformator]